MAQEQPHDDSLTTIRETVESIWIAIVLAFVLRAFVIEAFVIPTGSMAPRLMGQHWQFDCPACGYHYAFGLPGHGQSSLAGKTGGPPAVCPNCGYQYKFGSEYAFGGDRVLVLKYLYRFREPRPWEVVVFKNPQDNDQNYIKRLIGLPGQLVEIVHGDVFFCDGKDFNDDGVIDRQDFDLNHDGEINELDYATELWKQNLSWRILRKSPKTQEVMWQEVFNDDYLPDEATFAHDNQSWTCPWEGGGSWKINPQGRRVFAFDGSKSTVAVRFRREAGRFLPRYAYNQENVDYDRERDINTDLRLSFVFAPTGRSARVGLHLSSFRHHFRAWLSVDGRCVLEHGVQQDDGGVAWDERLWGQEQLSPLSPDRDCQVTLTHADRQVEFRVDGKTVLRSMPAQYPAEHDAASHEARGDVPVPTVEILGEGGAFTLRHVNLMRDVYYTSQSRVAGAGHATWGNPMVLRRFLNEPDRDEFFVLGDNSPASLDSRWWTTGAPTLRPDYVLGTVPRYNMIGRAFFVYWPGGYRLPLPVPGDAQLPLVPNVGRMRAIR